MKSLIAFTTWVCLVSSATEHDSTLRYLTYMNPCGERIVEDLKAPAPVFRVSESDVVLNLFTRKNPDDAFVAEHDDYNVYLNGSFFDSTKDTVFVIHGWLSNGSEANTEAVKNATLIARDVNVFNIDWSTLAESLYITARTAIPDIADVLGKLIKALIKDHNLDLGRTSLVGHSLGAHVAGITGQKLDRKVPTIVGLDPAFPEFLYLDLDGRLDPSDAQFVQVIHSQAGVAGIPYSLGDADYFPDGGSTHPSCVLVVTEACDHLRSIDFYCESLNSGNFVAYKCGNYLAFLLGLCKDEVSYMGEYKLDLKAKGDYYLKTNSKAPYAQGAIFSS